MTFLPRISRRTFLATFAASAAIPFARASAQTPVASPAPNEGPRFFIHPLSETEQGYPEVTLNPGEATQLGIGVTIRGDVPVDLTLYRADTVSIANGGFAAAELDDEPEGHTLWMDIEPTEFAASPGNTYEFTVPVNVPANATPGQYVSALVVQTNPLEISGTSTFNQIIRSALSVVINVPGEITPGMDIGEPDFTQQGGNRFLRIPVANTGNILVKPEGTVSMTTAEGEPVLTAPVAMKAIYLGLDNEIRIAIPDQVPDGDYLVSYELHEPEHDLHAAMDDVRLTLVTEETATPEAVTFAIEEATVTPNGDPVQFADVEIDILNNRSTIPTARVSLLAMRDGEEVETYDLASGQSIPQGRSTVSQRYIPATGWEPGTWTFRVDIAAVDGSGTETLLAEADIQDEIIVRT